MATSEQDKGSDEIVGPFECPLYKANLESALVTVTDCGRCVCTHCIQRSTELDKTCAVCNKQNRSHQFTEYEKDSPQVTDILIKIKDDKIEKRQVIIKERDKTIEAYKRQEQELTRRLEGLQKDLQDQEEQNNKDLNRQEQELTRRLDGLQKDLQDQEEQNKDLNKALTQTKKEVARLQEEVQNLQKYVQLCSDQDTELQNLYGNIIPEKDDTIAGLQGQIAQLSDDLDKTENEVKRLQAEVEHLLDDIATLMKNTVSVAHLEALSHTDLSRAIQQLQHCYDREYRCRYEITDKMEVLLQTRFEDVMNELGKTQEIGDQLALVIRTYVSVVEENSNLHRSLKTQEQELYAVRTELRQTKVNKFEMEQRNQIRYMFEE